MAKRVSIPITLSSPPIENECTSEYLLEYKLSGDAGYTALPLFPPPEDNTIVVDNLVAASLYNFRLTRYCCNGDNKTTEFNYTTSA